MHEVKKPKKNLAYYYLIVLLALMLFNAFAMPYIAEQQVEEVNYHGTFMSMTEKGKIGQFKSTTDYFTNKDNSQNLQDGADGRPRPYRETV